MKEVFLCILILALFTPIAKPDGLTLTNYENKVQYTAQSYATDVLLDLQNKLSDLEGKVKKISQVKGIQVLVYARAIERILIALFGGLSVVLGWYLFKIGVLDKQTMELKKDNWHIKLQRVSPGVFFAILGAAILIYCLQNPLFTDEVQYYRSVDKRMQYLWFGESMANNINTKLQNGLISEREAYDQLRALSGFAAHEEKD